MTAPRALPVLSVLRANLPETRTERLAASPGSTAEHDFWFARHRGAAIPDLAIGGVSTPETNVGSCVLLKPEP